MTQAEKILDHLQRYGSITPLEALNEYGCMRLAARILDLRQAGHAICSGKESRNGKSWSVYRYHSKAVA